MYPTLCSFKASYWPKISLLSRYIHRGGQAHIDGRGDERADIRPSCIVWDHTNGETLGSACLSTCVCEGGECLLSVDEGVQLRSDINFKEGIMRWNDLITHIVSSPLAGVDHSVKDKMTDALQEELEGNLGF